MCHNYWPNDQRLPINNQGSREKGEPQSRMLNAILQEANMDANQDEDVLEQYRIMADVEARNRIKENTGFDMTEYERQRKLHPEPNKLQYFDKDRRNPKQILPDTKSMEFGSERVMMRAEEPPLPPPRPNRRYLEQKAPTTPDLVNGTVLVGGFVPWGYTSVKCLGCKQQLKVDMFATLVRCSECFTVTPVTASRR